MGRFIDLLLAQPILLIVLLAWVAGIIGNILKAAKRSRERAEQQARQRHGELPSAEARSAPPPPQHEPEPRGAEPPPLPRHGEPRSEQIAREMRRILGMEESTSGDVATTSEQPRHRERSAEGRTDHEEAERTRREREALADQLRAQRAARERVEREARQAREAARAASRRRDVVLPERAPRPVVPTTGARRLEIHVDPHVGERIQRRSPVQSGRVGAHAVGHELGQLGGRARPRARTRAEAGARYALDDLKRALVLSEILGPPLALRRGEREV